MDDNSDLIKSLEESYQEQNHVKKRLSFGVCFKDDGGFMTIDFRADKVLNKLKFFKSPERLKDHWKFEYQPTNGFFMTTLSSIQIGSLVDKNLDTSLIFDTGTTFTHLPSKVAEKLFRLLNQFC